MTTTLAKWFEIYSESHKDKTNKIIHYICVPVIIFSLLGLLSGISIANGNSSGVGKYLHFTLAEIFILFASIFYIRHSFQLFLGFIVFSIICLFLIYLVKDDPAFPSWIVFSIIFSLAWIGQFIGHKHEGKKPSFLTDLVFLLIGPAWIIGFLYRRLGISF
jgi:uncharacterized membrane protein YGL010W